MTSLALVKVRLRQEPSIAALRALLVPVGSNDRAMAGHHLIWTLFADTPDRRRDFLWREADDGGFFILSSREPVDRHGLFEITQSQAYPAEFAIGQRYGFLLRANATTSWGGSATTRGHRADVVMAALKGVAAGERAERRAEIAATAGRGWIERVGERSGFVLATQGEAAAPLLSMPRYRVMRIPRGGAPMKIGVLDFDGVIDIVDPERFREAIGEGFGRAKAFGCGLMLLRPIDPNG